MRSGRRLIAMWSSVGAALSFSAGARSAMSPPSEDSSPSSSFPDPKPEFTPEERALLLQLARDAILSKLEEREMPAFEPASHLSEPRGVFTTVYLGNRLKGCVGYPLALMPLHRATVETARS